MGHFSEFYSMNVDSTESKTHDMLKMSIVNAAQQNLVVCLKTHFHKAQVDTVYLFD